MTGLAAGASLAPVLAVQPAKASPNQPQSAPISPRRAPGGLMTERKPDDLEPLLRRIADALERLAPAAPPSAGLDSAEAFIWHAESRTLEAVAEVNRVD